MAPSNKRGLPFIRSALTIDRLRLQAGAQLEPPFDSVVAVETDSSIHLHLRTEEDCSTTVIRVAGRSVEA
jgi:hypothetical protein